MRTITSKAVIKDEWQQCLQQFDPANISPIVQALYTRILSAKVKFPLLEYCGTELYQQLPPTHHIDICDAIHNLKTEGGNVILGKVLQHRLGEHYSESIEKAIAYIADADAWYVCDIIGERVFGHALLYWPQKTVPKIKKLAQHPSFWVVRSLGAGAHYAIKKGLEKTHVKRVFALLLSMANTSNKEIRQGVGWAAKTTAKFHPDVIQQFQDEINDEDKVANWFRAKVQIGLKRNEYGQEN